MWLKYLFGLYRSLMLLKEYEPLMSEKKLKNRALSQQAIKKRKSISQLDNEFKKALDRL